MFHAPALALTSVGLGWPGSLGIGADVLWASALLAALSYGLWAAPRLALDRHAVYWLAIVAIGGGLLSARLPDLMMHGLSGPDGLLARARSSFAGYAGGILCGILAARVLGVALRPGADLAARSVLVGECVGRFGCLIHGDDFGRPTSMPFGVWYPAGTLAHASQVAQGIISPDAPWSVPVHPWPLYASVAAAIILVIAIRLGRGLPAGRQAGFILVVYGCARLGLASLRGDVGSEWWWSSQALWAYAFTLTGVVLELSLLRGARASVVEIARAV